MAEIEEGKPSEQSQKNIPMFFRLPHKDGLYRA